MKNFNRYFMIMLFSCLVFAIAANADDQDQLFVDSVNSNWVARNYTQILAAVNVRLQANSNDVLALSLKMNYYFYCDMNIPNVYAVAHIFTNAVRASGRTEVLPIAQVMAQRFFDLPLSEPSFTEAQRNALHSEFSDMFPGVEECEAFSLSLNSGCDLHVRSENPSDGVSIQIFPWSENTTVSRTTSFDRVYMKGIVVKLSAPSNVSGKSFAQWNKDGLSISTTTNVMITISNNVTMTAVYIP